MTTPAFVRTADERFRPLTDYRFEPHYRQWRGLRVHHLDEGPRDAPVMLLLHGEPTWSHLYRRIIPRLVAAGHRCIAPDLVGFGRSDKVTDERPAASGDFFVRCCPSSCNRAYTTPPRSSVTISCRYSGVPFSGATGSPTTSSTFANQRSRDGRLIEIGRAHV